MDSSSASTSSDHRQYLNNLPHLIYNHILKNLDLDDLWNSRLISKRFHSIIKSYEINELTFLDYRSCQNDNWFASIMPPRPEYYLPSSKLDILIHPSKNLLNIKCLKIQDINQLFFKLENLNKFTKLQILEIGPISLNSHSLLKLPDLKALFIHFYYDLGGFNLVIDAPILNSLAIRCQNDLEDNEIKFNHPLSIKYLRIYNYDINSSIFTNLEFLEFYGGFYGLEEIELLHFSNLKTLRFNDCEVDVHDNLIDINELNDLFVSKKNGLEFVLDGVKIKEINKIDEYRSRRSALEFQLNNYNELEDDLWFVSDINYNELVSLFPANESGGLLAKFTNIKSILIGSIIEDSSLLIRFIRGFHNLYQLGIKNSSLNQQFYDQLTIIKSLSTLSIGEKINLNLNFKFVMKMPYLRELFTNQDVLIGSQLNLNDFKRLKWFRFEIDRVLFDVRKEDRDRYKINNFKQLNLPDHDSIEHNQLVEWSTLLRNKKE